MSRINQQESFGRAVRAIRSRLKLTQADFAAEVGCNQNTISRYEAGKLLPSNEILTKVWKIANQAERCLLKAYLSDLLSLFDKDEQIELFNQVLGEEGVASLRALARMYRLYEKHKGEPDVAAPFEQAAVWLETEFEMRSLLRRPEQKQKNVR